MNQQLRYHPDADQLSLVSTFSDSLDALLPLDRLHRSLEESAETWSEFESIGLFGIGLPEEEGGSGLGATEETLIVVELGQRLAAPSILATIGAMHAAGTDSSGAARRATPAWLNGQRIVVIEDRQASHVLLRDGGNTALYEQVDNVAPLDDTLWHVRLGMCQLPPEPVASFDEAGRLRLKLIDAAALAGIAQAAVVMAVEYAGLRKQFGRFIGSFQAVKHHCANMAIRARCARDQAAFAAVALDDRRDDAELQVESALLVAIDAALENAGKNIQIHGGMGFSAEADPHLLLKRAQVLTAIAGGLEASVARMADVKIGIG